MEQQEGKHDIYLYQNINHCCSTLI